MRKAGGVYYTPEYIVRYIVGKHVGKLIEGKKPEEIKEMRFADIACGSGSFLLGVYDVLLRYHTAYYKPHEEARSAGGPDAVEAADGKFRLSHRAKKRDFAQEHLRRGHGRAGGRSGAVFALSQIAGRRDDRDGASPSAEFRRNDAARYDAKIIYGNSLIDWDILDGGLFERSEERKLYPLGFAGNFPK